MKENFRKIQKKREFTAAIASAVYAVASGAFVAGGLLLVLKLCNVAVPFWVYLIAGVGAGAAVFVLAYLLLRPTKKRLARSLDEEFALGEQVQTALEFEGAEGAMLDVQREKTEETLSALPKRRTRYGNFFAFLTASNFWQRAAACILSAAVLVTALILPPPAPVSADTLDPPYEVTDYEIAVIEELIRNVRSSYLENGEKESAVSVLEGLITDLRAAQRESEKRTAVLGAIDGVESGITGGNTYPAIYSALTSARLLVLGRAVLRGGEIYRETTLLTYEQTKTYYASRTDVCTAASARLIAEYRLGFSLAANLADTLESASSGIAGAVIASKADADDGLAMHLLRFARQLGEAGEGLGTEDYDAQAHIDDAFSEFSGAIAGDLGDQSYKQAMSRFVCNKLKTTFGMEADGAESLDDDPILGDGSDSDDDDDDDDHNPAGGFGSGDATFPSNDEVFDPRTEKYVKYGELLAEYYAAVQRLLQQDTVSAEEREIVQSYFEMLFSGIKAEE